MDSSDGDNDIDIVSSWNIAEYLPKDTQVSGFFQFQSLPNISNNYPANEFQVMYLTFFYSSIFLKKTGSLCLNCIGVPVYSLEIHERTSSYSSNYKR